MQDGILDHRLHGHLNDHVIHVFFRHITDIVKYLHVPYLLEIHIVLRQRKFLPESDLVPCSFCHISQQVLQAHHSIRHAVRLLDHSHPAHRIKGIVQEMRIDLRLKSVHFKLLLLFIHLFLCFDQAIDMTHKTVERFADLRDLIFPLFNRWICRQIFRIDLPADMIGQHAERSRNPG